MKKREKKKNSASGCRKAGLDRTPGATMGSLYPASFDPSWGSDEETIYLFDGRIDELIIDG